mmetsp:Transcript_51224/g.128532  ORF Transcript_51224/g.128532 Transcript_51224/m.128532 type:complete len:370 (+) Transcript_51224:537-1646(+)
MIGRKIKKTVKSWMTLSILLEMLTAAVLLVAVVIALIILGNRTDNSKKPSGVEVDMIVFSGKPNPALELTVSEFDSFNIVFLESLQQATYPTHRTVGYRGFIVRRTNVNKNEYQLVRGNNALELYLASLFQSTVEPSVYSHTLASIADLDRNTTDTSLFDCAYRREACGPSSAITAFRCCRMNVCACLKGQEECTCFNDIPQPVASDERCNGTVVTSNNPLGDPTPSCIRYSNNLNNCYNYAACVFTFNYSQPGKGSGSKYSDLLCTSLRSAAVRDGMRFVGISEEDAMRQASERPGLVLTALLIWPGSDFLFLRRNKDGYYAYKAGISIPTNIDNNGRIIEFVEAANLAPYSVSCGFFLHDPEKMKIE